ncbi:MAG: hypothetical protein V1906_03855 [Candidatus Woesearchaeota archaeon]
MFNAKEINDIKERIEEISTELIKFKSESMKVQESSKEAMSLISKSIDEIKSIQSSYLKTMAQEAEHMALMRNEFEKTAKSFDQMHKKIYEMLYSKMSEVLREHNNDLKSTTENYRAMSPKVIEILSTLDKLALEISKFNAISRSIKETDFSLINHQKDLERMDREKLYLMKKIDNLERMVGKERMKRTPR